MPEPEQVRHLSVEFEDGAVVTLPAEAWTSQDTVRAILTALRGREPARLSDEEWVKFVWAVADAAEKAER